MRHIHNSYQLYNANYNNGGRGGGGCSGGGDGDEHILAGRGQTERVRSNRSLRRQQRGSQYDQVQALRAFQQQHAQFDRGAKKFQGRLETSAKEIIAYVNHEHAQRSTKQTKGYGRAVAELTLREHRAVSRVHQEVQHLIQTGRYGYAPREKPDDTIRLMVENWNSLGVFTGKSKVSRVNSLLRSFEVDVIAGSETQCDWRQVEQDSRFEDLIAPGVSKRVSVGHNITEPVDETPRAQMGGTAMAALGRLSASVIDTGQDHTGLGRWSWILVGHGTQRTRIVTAYQPCSPPKSSKGFTVFEQQQRYFEPKGDLRSPRTIFMEHLIAQLKVWKHEGNEIILAGDFNEHVYNGRLAKRLADEDLGMTEMCLKTTGQPIPPTHLTGSRPIDAVFATSGVVCSNACILQKYGGVGDHRCFILDFTSASVLGDSFPNVVPPSARNLHCDSVRIRSNYCEVLNQLCDRHQMFAKLNSISRVVDDISAAEFQLRMNRWDDELTDYMLAAEKRCRKYKQTHLEYSPTVGAWLRRRWLLGRVKRYLQGKVPDPRNLKRACLKKDCLGSSIGDPRDFTLDTVEAEMYICIKQLDELRAKAPELRQKHLKACLKKAQDAEDEEKAAAIAKVIRREAVRKRWRRICASAKPPRGRAVLSVKVKLNGEETEYNTEADVFEQVSHNLGERFRLALSAPACHGQIFDDIGFLGDTAAAQMILEGTYVYPPDMDPATRLLLEEAAATYASLSREQIASMVTAEDFRYYWQRVNERISSSYSKLHFGHYKAAAWDSDLCNLHAQKLSLCARRGEPLARWGRGLTVLLEKIMGNNFVNKLRAICLFEADFNWWNKLIFAKRMMGFCAEKGVIPDELFAKKGTQCVDATMTKTFISDTSKVLHHPMAISEMDFSDCYDRAVHNVSSIALQAHGIPRNSSVMMLTALQTMQFFLRTGFGESSQSYGGTAENPTMGYGQGNGAAPPAFAVLSSLVVKAYKRMGHGANLSSAMFQRVFLLAAVMYVDDTDLIHWAHDSSVDAEDLLSQVQEEVTNWGLLAQATGGALKQAKCSVCFMFYIFRNGKATLAKVRQLPPAPGEVQVVDKQGVERTYQSHIRIPQPDGTTVPIPTRETTDASKMLGVHYACAGDGTTHCREMKAAGVQWVDGLKSRPLHRRDAWMSFHLQLTPKVSYGIAAVVHPPKKIDESFQSVLYQALPLLGVNRCITRFWRTLPIKYQGLGLPDFVVVACAAKVAWMLRHWGFDDTAGNAMMQAFEAFVIETGLYGNVFSQDYKVLGCLATDGTWFKNLWQTLRHLGVHLQVGEDHQLRPLRERDAPVLGELARKGYRGATLARLGRVAHYKGVIHISDMVQCDGQSFDPAVIDDSPGRSMKYTFPREQPTSGDFRLWENALVVLGTVGMRLDERLGEYVRPRHRPTEWYMSEDEEFVYFWDEADFALTYEVFVRHPTRRPTRLRQFFVWARTEVGQPPRERYATVSEVDATTVAVESYAPIPRELPSPTGFWPVLQSFPNQGLWKNFVCDGDGGWIRRGLRMGSLVIVHDGSYMKHVDKRVCSAAFMIYCTSSRSRAKGTVVEHSLSADNYRGEILGGLMVQLVLRAALSGHMPPYRPVHIDCDNKGVVSHGNTASKALRDKQPQADALRCFKRYVVDNVTLHRLEVVYRWVASHQDDHKRRSELTLVEKINVVVDRLAKLALLAGVEDEQYIDSDFPFEPLRLVIDGKKATGSAYSAISEDVGRRQARAWYHAKKIIHRSFFNLVWWQGVGRAMKSYPQLYRVWVTKHTSRFCGTNRQLARIDSSVKNVCPSCGCRNESSTHLTRCSDPVRVQMFELTVGDLVTWMRSTKVDGALVTLVRDYLLGRGRTSMTQVLGDRRSPLALLARTHDKLGWRNFLEGRICSLFIETASASLPERRSPEKWGADFISRLLQIVHRQWLLRNAHVHYRKLDGLTEAQHTAILARIRDLLWTDPADLLERHRYLLEVDLHDLGAGSTARRQVWAASMRSALATAERVRSLYSSSSLVQSPSSSRSPGSIGLRSRGSGMVYRRSQRRTT